MEKPVIIQRPKPVVKVEEIKVKEFYLVAYRLNKEQPWTHKGVGPEFFRSKEKALDRLPEDASEAHVIAITLPI